MIRSISVHSTKSMIKIDLDISRTLTLYQIFLEHARIIGSVIMMYIVQTLTLYLEL